MHIILDSRRTSGGRRHRLQARFDKLQQQLARQEQRNRKFREELDELTRRYLIELARIDNDHLAARTRLAEKLIEFFTRKSLSHWHRDELADWIVEAIGRVAGADAATADRLHVRFRQAAADLLGMSEAEMKEQARMAFESVAEAFEGLYGDDEDDQPEAPFRDDGQEDLFGYDDIFEEVAAGGAAPDEDIADERLAAGAGSRGLMDGSWVRTLFQRTARALHPDRERDPDQRALKESLMQRLLAARKQGDILGLLQLYGDSAAEGQVVLAEGEMEQACELMEARRLELEQEQEDLIMGDPVRGFVYRELYGPTRQKRECKLQDWKRSMEAEAAQVSDWVRELRNLKVLKLALEERREQRIFESFDVMAESLHGVWGDIRRGA